MYTRAEITELIYRPMPSVCDKVMTTLIKQMNEMDEDEFLSMANESGVYKVERAGHRKYFVTVKKY